MSEFNWNGRTVLVTGCAGFIASHLVEKLLSYGCAVVGIDHLNDYYSSAQKRLNLEEFNGNPDFEFHQIDLAHDEYESLVEKSDVVIHLAAQPGVRASWGEGFATYLDRNLLATQRLLEIIRSHPKRLVFASSSSVYGNALAFPTREETTRQPVSPYGMTKSACEDMIRIYHENFGIEAYMMRYFTVYGPHQRPDMAFHRILRAAADGSTFTVFGDGTQARDVTYVADIADATLAAAHRPLDGVQALNIGGGEVIQLKDVLDHVATFAEPGFEIKYAPFEAGDAKVTSADISKARDLIGYEPSTDWKTGIRRQWESIQQRGS